MRCEVVLESGLNHNGSRERLLAMVESAALCGVDGFKVQAFTAAEFTDEKQTYTYLEAAADLKAGMNRVTERQRDLFARCQLSFDDISAAHKLCLDRKLKFYATATDPEWIQKIATLPQAHLKIGSDDLVHEPLLAAAKATGLPVVLSTGMASELEIERALTICEPAVLLHCVSLYPTPPHLANLTRMTKLRELYGLPVGFSDHTTDDVAAQLATAMGAVMIEKHFTLDRTLHGPDHWFSANPDAVRRLVLKVRVATVLRGPGDIDPGPRETEMRRDARRSVVAARYAEVGDALLPDLIAYQRPGGGLTPGQELPLLGLLLRRPLRRGDMIVPSDVANTREVLN